MAEAQEEKRQMGSQESKQRVVMEELIRLGMDSWIAACFVNGLFQEITHRDLDRLEEKLKLRLDALGDRIKNVETILAEVSRDIKKLVTKMDLT
ncbi:hypothetical protein [Borrelia sp. P9F1]|uniref:hypothetical protein n=1 Tax=Borrelia sp. P9F1 TaxID=3058374 RepID=UPI002647FA0F|nr:hypothetical protein [Borrelia sp. P9F1]WKC58486.1 hypothetical protein QYZ68_04520 [Borrelia sp. P9F1]